MINVIKSAAIYTSVYFIIFTVFFWSMLFLTITITAFWKSFAAIFVVLVAVFTWDHYNVTDQLRKIFEPKGGVLVACTRCKDTSEDYCRC